MSMTQWLIWGGVLTAVLLFAYAKLSPGGKKLLQWIGIAFCIAVFLVLLLIVGVLALVSFVLFGVGVIMQFLGEKGCKFFPVLFSAMWEKGLACVPGLGKKS